MCRAGVYILRSVKSGRYYIGSTNDVHRRVAEHNHGYVASTKNLTPLVLMVFVQCTTLGEARAAEYRLKQYKRKDILEKVVADGIFPWNHAPIAQW